ncbi:MAG: T9SS type A sorting domain-containing protein [Rhodothermales bacterium]|nr:T9SS type A sorting domain-containing protein [Rhodothermales bacterium]
MLYRTIVLAAALISIATHSFAQNVRYDQQQSTATYSVEFTSTWSATSHPDDFPADAHYSPLKGVTHNGSVTFWDAGQLASPGVESMAETGSNTILDSEMTEAINAGTAEFVVNGPGINVSPGSASFNFDISSTHSRFSLVSMIAPSPDWFVGINSLDLFPGGLWVDTIGVTAYVYDAGTDDGSTYTAANADSDPHVAIERIEQSPFQYAGVVTPVGRFFLALVSVTGLDENPGPRTLLSGPFPNPFSSEAYLTLENGTGESATIELYDIIGRQVAQDVVATTSGTQLIKLPSENLSPGIYVYRVTSGPFLKTGTAVLVR